MNRKNIEHQIDKLPPIVRRNIVRGISFLPNRVIHGEEYLEKREFLNSSQWWSKDRLQEYQNEKLRALIKHAYNNVPYYRKIFDQRGLKPDDIKKKSDLKKLPYLTKSDIRKNYQDLLAVNISERVQKETSGSTGQPFKFEEPPELGQIERAFINRAFRSHGTDLYHQKTVWLRSYSPSENEPIYKHSPHLKILYLSPFHLSQDRISEYVDHIQSFGGNALVGYPSSIYIFSTMLEKTNHNLANIDIVHTGSENMPKAWRNRIESILDIPVKDHYGMAEKVSLLHQCSESNAYHENMEYGILEVINKNGNTGEIVGTSLWNYTMPLIRYRMGDRATVRGQNQTCSCGRGLPLTVDRFEGRQDDIIKTPDNRMLPSVNFYTLMHEVTGVDMFKIVQKRIDKINIYIVTNESYNSRSESELMTGLQQRLGVDMMINIKQADSIERNNETGKIRCIISEI